MSSSPTLNSALTAQSLEPGACFGFSLSICPSPAHTLSLSKINIFLKKPSFSSKLPPNQGICSHTYYLVSIVIKHHILFLNVYYLFLRERERAGEGQRERGTEDLKWALHWQQRSQCGARTHEPWDHDLSWSQMLSWLSCPAAQAHHRLQWSRELASPKLGQKHMFFQIFGL